MALALTDEDIADISAYYAKQKISANTLPVPEADDDEQAAANVKPNKDIQTLIAQGSDLYRNGDLKREVSACIACHGGAKATDFLGGLKTVN